MVKKEMEKAFLIKGKCMTVQKYKGIWYILCGGLAMLENRETSK